MYFIIDKLVDNILRDLKVYFIYVNSHVDSNSTKIYVNI
jgi:hypothetical protein